MDQRTGRAAACFCFFERAPVESSAQDWKFAQMEHPVYFAPRCPTFTKIVQPSRLNGWCRLMCGLRSQLPAG